MSRPKYSAPRVLTVVICLSALLLLAGCAGVSQQSPAPAGRATPPPPAGQTTGTYPAPPVTTPWPTRISPASQQIPSFASLAPAVDRSIARAAKKPPQSIAIDRPGAQMTWGQLHHALVTFRNILPELDRNPAVLGKYFKWVPLDSDTLLTGYYEPTIEVSHTQSAAYPWPIYRNPGSQGKRHSREAIDYKGALRGQGLEIGYAKNLIDVFFMHVQGSGKLRFVEDGSTIYALFDGKNSHPYVAVGGVMVNRGCFPREEMSMQRIRQYLDEHPNQVREYLTQNPSYIFFKTSQTPPVGAMGVPVTPHCSVAVDPGFVPFGALMVVDGDLPGFGPGPATERFTGFVMAQDTGCMRGNHFDLYLGPGEKAAHQAGLMKGRAKAYILMPR